ncbi:MAG: Asp-tRNA(Asn)/Glu-tRNA(Gln) amidotransferase subunit GatB [Candidatus Gracilibacteria bacterium]|nr:Asp-tRNA(Asn)/Glu-tRNA(Gln) amidotransferase subunit GatB [Candidatus Gracilibacteria bacterium]
MTKYIKTIGLEIHIRVKSKTKMFCSCTNAVALAEEPNINVCPVCMGFPGMLPALNKEVVRLGMIGGMMMGCEINKVSRFDRKTYFYPDNPTAYQITQLYEPIVGKGSVKVIVDDQVREFAIHHMHLENDAGKLVHAGGKTLCDFNRAGSPLMEIVTDPVFHDREEVMEFLKELQKLMRAGGVSDADMEKGQMRCDVNISVAPEGSSELGSRTETKNVNSFSAIGRVIDHESKRQINILESGGVVDQETRGWDDETGTSKSQRSKEDAMDYRYFPEPDLLPLVLDDEFIAEARAGIPELPIEKRLRYLNEYGLGVDDARLLTTTRELSEYFDELVKLTNDPKKSCSYITSTIIAMINESSEINSIDELRFDIKELARVIQLINNKELSSTNAKQVIDELFKNGGETDIIVDENNLRQKNDTEALEKIVDEVLANNTAQVQDYKGGNVNIFGFFVGQCMKASKGQGNPVIFNELLKKKLD